MNAFTVKELKDLLNGLPKELDNKLLLIRNNYYSSYIDHFHYFDKDERVEFYSQTDITKKVKCDGCGKYIYNSIGEQWLIDPDTEKYIILCDNCSKKRLRNIGNNIGIEYNDEDVESEFGED